MNFVKVVRVLFNDGKELGKPVNIKQNIWIDVFTIFMVQESVNGFLRIYFKPINQCTHDPIDVSMESLPAIEAAFKRHELPF